MGQNQPLSDKYTDDNQPISCMCENTPTKQNQPINQPTNQTPLRTHTLTHVARLPLSSNIGVIILTGEGPLAFCSGGDQRVRGVGGYDDGSEDVPRLRVLDLHVQMRRCPKPIIAMVAGYAIGGGHILHMVADLTIAADNAVFGQTGPRVGRWVRG